MKPTSSSIAPKIARPHASHRRVPPHSNSLAARTGSEPIPAGAAPAAAISAALDLHTVRIGYFQPEAREVYVAGSFNGWDPRETPLQRDTFGDWSVDLSLPPGEHRYRLVVDGEWRDDPSAQRMEANPYGGFDAVVVV